MFASFLPFPVSRTEHTPAATMADVEPAKTEAELEAEVAALMAGTKKKKKDKKEKKKDKGEKKEKKKEKKDKKKKSKKHNSDEDPADRDEAPAGAAGEAGTDAPAGGAAAEGTLLGLCVCGWHLFVRICPFFFS